MSDSSSSRVQAEEQGTQIEQAPKAPNPDDEKKIAKKLLNQKIYGNCLGILAIFPPLYNGVCTIAIFFFYGKIISILSSFEIDGIERMSDAMYNIYWMIGLYAVYAITKFIDKYLWEYLSIKVTSSLKRTLFTSMMKSDVNFFDANPIGRLLTVFNEDAEEIRASTEAKSAQFSNIAQFLAGTIFAFVYSWKLALVGVAVIPLTMIIVSFMTPCLIKAGGMQFMTLSKVMTFAEERISHIRTVRSFNRERDEVSSFRDLQTIACKYDKKINLLGQMMFFIIMTFIQTILVVIFFYGTHLIDDSKKADGTYGFTVGDLFSVWGFLFCGIFGLISFQGSLQTEVKSVLAISRIIKLSSYQPSISFDDGDEPSGFNGEIEFKDVTFRYPTRQGDVLKNVSFKIPKGKTCAFVGKSGSGKTTCTQLLERYYDVNDGEILIEGKNIKDINPRWLHQNIGIVPQEASLFAKTISENITYGANKEVKQSDIESAADLANISNFINTKLEQKYETFVGEKGVQLSGGQKQRLAIARAIIKDPKVFIFDEATSSLDVESERKIQDSLEKILKGKTSIIIAHRLSTIKKVDLIYVFSNGEIVESGTHDELLEKQGQYYRLVYRQLETSSNTTSENEVKST